MRIASSARRRPAQPIELATQRSRIRSTSSRPPPTPPALSMLGPVDAAGPADGDRELMAARTGIGHELGAGTSSRKGGARWIEAYGGSSTSISPRPRRHHEQGFERLGRQGL